PLCCRTMPGLMVLALIFMRTVGLVAGGRQAPTARAWRAKSPGALEDKPKKGNGAPMIAVTPGLDPGIQQAQRLVRLGRRVKPDDDGFKGVSRTSLQTGRANRD